MSSRSLNKVQLIGNLTREPEIRYTPSGAAMCSFGIATNRSWKDSEGGQREEAEFHNLVAWNKMAEICYQLLAKGMKVYIEGELRTRSWEDDSGSKRYRTEIKINEMILLDNRGKSGAGGSPKGTDDVSIDDVISKADDSAGNSKNEKKVKKEEKSKLNATKKSDKDEGNVKTEEKVKETDPLADDLPF